MSIIICGVAGSWPESCISLPVWTLFSIIFGMFFMFFTYFILRDNSEESDEKARKIMVEYTDGKKETLLGTEWSRYDDVVAIYNNELEDNSVKEINFDSIKSIGFVLQKDGE